MCHQLFKSIHSALNVFVNLYKSAKIFIGLSLNLNQSCCRDHCPPLLFPTLYGKRGIFTCSPLLWVFDPFSFHCYCVCLPCFILLTHVLVVINCPYSVAQMCTREDALAHNLGALCIDDVMSYNSLTTLVFADCSQKMVVSNRNDGDGR